MGLYHEIICEEGNLISPKILISSRYIIPHSDTEVVYKAHSNMHFRNLSQSPTKSAWGFAPNFVLDS